MRKQRQFSLLLILLSLIGYLEWGGDNHNFLFEAEWEILQKMMSDPTSVLHPFITIPLIGQILLFVTIFQSKPTGIIQLIGVGLIGMLFLFMLFIGILSTNLKIIASTLPFITAGTIFIIKWVKSRRNNQS